MPGSILVVTFDTSTGIRTGRLVGSTLLEDNAVVSGKIGSGQIASAHLTATLVASIEAGVSDEGVTSAKLASGAVIGDRIAFGALVSGHFGSGQIASGHLVSAIAGLVGSVADGGVTSAKVASGIIAGVHIKDGSILSGEIGAGAIGDTLLKDFGLLSGKYASGSITEQALVSGISIDISELSQDPTYRAKQLISAAYCVYVAAVSGNYVDIALAVSGRMPAVGIMGANTLSGQIGVINYAGRAAAPTSVVSGQYGKQVFVNTSGLITVTPPSTSGYCQQIMGAVKDDNEIMLFPEPGCIEIA